MVHTNIYVDIQKRLLNVSTFVSSFVSTFYKYICISKCWLICFMYKDLTNEIATVRGEQ